jgi:hypothetical protein
MRNLMPAKCLLCVAASVCLLTTLTSTLPSRALAAASRVTPAQPRPGGQQVRRRRPRSRRPAAAPASATQTPSADRPPAPAESPRPTPEPRRNVPTQVLEQSELRVVAPSEGQVVYPAPGADAADVTVSVEVAKPDRWQLKSIGIYEASSNRLLGQIENLGQYSRRYPKELTGLKEGFYDLVVEAAFESLAAGGRGERVTPEPVRAPLHFIVLHRAASARKDNGITVGETKLYDDRALDAKLQQLERDLGRLGFVDQAGVAKGLGTLQGARQSVSSMSLNVTGLPTPGVSTVENSNSSANSNTSSIQTTTNSASVTPSVPALPGQAPAISPQLSFGQNAQDLLAEQVQLTYQLINLRTLLERAITDRVAANVGEAKQRRQAVVGFQIGLDSRGRYRNAVAEVDVRVTSLTPVENRLRPNLVSLIPKEKTYNVATISRNARQFGFGAVVQVVNVGASFARSRDAFYLVRDTDTVAVERPWPFIADESGRAKEEQGRENPAAITFGWQFRPVLGRKAVEPGSRGVFALLSLPPSEFTTYVAKVEAFTRWRKYDSKTGTVGDFILGSDSTQVLDELIVPPDIDEALRPVAQNVRWEDTNDGKALVVVNGKNFLPGTGVLVGNTLLDGPDDGFVLSDEKSFRFSVPVSGLIALTDLQLVGRFGSPFPLRTELEHRDDFSWGIRVNGPVKFSPVDAKVTQVTLDLTAKECPGGAASCFPVYASSFRPLVMVGKTVFGFSDAPVAVTLPGGDTIRLSFKAPSDLLGANDTLKVRYPFLEPWAYTAEVAYDFGSSFGVKNAVVLASDDTTSQVAVRGSKFERGRVTVTVGSKVYKDGDNVLIYLSEDLLQLNLPLAPKDLAKVKNLIVAQDGHNLILPLAVAPQPSPKPSVISADNVTVGDSKIIKLKGANFGSIQEVRFEGRVLSFDLDDDGATLLLSVPGEMTALPGTKAVTFALKDGKTVIYELKVQRQ